MHVICPSCHNPIELRELAPREEIACPSCGSGFRLETESTTVGEQEGARKLGKFELLGAVGQGAFGTVYRARDPELDRTVAVKVPRTGNLAGPRERDRFLREARSVAQLRHPSIVTVLEVGEADGVPYLVSDFVQGITLADLLSARRPGFREAAELVATVAEVLQYAHEQGVVHRDVKPSNIMIAAGGRPCVMDFGLAKREAGEITLTVEGQVLGTPAYMSPEQARGEAHTVDGRSDVYSLGVVLYLLLTGELPFRGTQRMLLHQVLQDEPRPPRNLNDRIPRDLETITLKAMAKEPGRRYPAARALADDLRCWLIGGAIRAQPVGKLERAWRWCRRNPAVAALLLAVGVSLLGGAAFSGHFAIQEGRRATEAAENATEAAENAAEAAENAEAAGIASQRANKEARAAKESAANHRRAREDAERRRYVSELRLVRAAWDNKQLQRVRELLAAHRPISPDSTDLRGFEWYYWQRKLDEGPLTIQHPPEVRHLAFSPDGTRLATTAGGTEVLLWDAGTGQKRGSLRVVSGATRLAFAPDGKRLAIVGPGAVTVWDLPAGRELTSLKQPGGAQLAAFSPDGQQLALVSALGSPFGENREVKLWNFAQGGAVLSLFKNTRRVHDLAFDASGKHLAVGSDTGVWVWDGPGGKPLGPLAGHTSPVVGVVFCPDGRLLSASQVEGIVRGGAGLQELHRFPVLAEEDGRLETAGWKQSLFAGGMRYSTGSKLALSADGSRLSAVTTDGRIVVRELATGQSFSLAGHGQTVRALSFSPDGRRLASAGEDGTVLIWSAEAGTHELHLAGPLADGGPVAFSADGRLIATTYNAGLRGGVTLWDASSGAAVVTFPSLHNAPIGRLALSPDGKWLVTTDDGNTPKSGRAILWNAVTGQRVTTLKDHAKDNCLAVAFHPRASRFATSDHDGRGIKIWETPTGKLLRTLKCPTEPIHLVYSPDGTRLAVGEKDGVRIWDEVAGRPERFLPARGAHVWPLAFSGDGKRLACGGERETVIHVWDTNTWEECLTLKGHVTPVCFVGFTPDGKRLISASAVGAPRLGEMKVWDLITGEELLGEEGLRWLCFGALSRDGQRLALATTLPAAKPLRTSESVRVLDVRPLTDQLRAEQRALREYQYLLERVTMKEAMREHVRRDRSLDDALRERVLKRIEAHKDDPRRLSDASWSASIAPGAGLDAYRLAIRQAEAASRLQPRIIDHVRCRGVARFRAGQHREALADLTLANRVYKGRHPAVVAFLALTQNRLGDKPGAVKTLEQLQGLKKAMPRPDNLTQALVREVEQALRGP